MPTLFSRRHICTGLALFGCGGTLGAARITSLSELGETAGIEIGCAVSEAMLRDPALAALIAGEVGVVTPELELKWGAIAPTADTRFFAGADAVFGFAQGHGLRVRGHTLLWHRSVPEWAVAALGSGAGWGLVADHIRQTVRRYRHGVDEWDVVNEPIGDDGALRSGPLLTAFGRDYVDRALHEAHSAAPTARLAINEYGIEYDRADQAARRAGLLDLLRALKRGGAPLHRVGMQAHLDLNHGPLAAAGLRDLLSAVADLGLQVSITELDVKERDLIAPVAERDAQVADHVAAFLDLVLPHPAVRSLTTWGLSDRHSWLAISDADRARFPGAWADGSSPGLNRGLPYDAAGKAKPMRAAITTRLTARR